MALVCVRTVERVWSKYLKAGHYKPEPLNCGRKPKITQQTMDNILTKIKQQPDITLRELIEEFNLPLSQAALCKRLKKHGLTFKKRRSIQKTKNEPT
ncbi:MAG: IS630 transposase-related protein [Nitrososphaerota archaeon]|jgi:transposase|nr:IS630 transposase-related protein [Nitrososphaerota archaeon]